MFDQLGQFLDILFSDLELYLDINKDVRAKSKIVTDLAESLRVLSLDGVIAASKLGSMAAGLRSVLDGLRESSGLITTEGIHLSASLDELVKEVDRSVFGLSAAKLQIEMASQFAHELIDSSFEDSIDANVDRMTEGAMEKLSASSCGIVRTALSGLTAIQERLRSLTKAQEKLHDSSRSLRPIYLTGKVELSAATGHRLAAVFKDVGEQVTQMTANLDELKDILTKLEVYLVRGLSHGEQVEETLAQIDSRMKTTQPYALVEAG